MRRRSSPEGRKLADLLAEMRAVIKAINEETDKLFAEGQPVQEKDTTEDAIRTVTTSTGAGTTLLDVAVSMLIDPGDNTEEQRLLRKIGKAAEKSPRYVTILALGELLRKSMKRMETAAKAANPRGH